MNNKNLRTYEMILRVRDFAIAEADAFPATSKGGQLFATVTAAAGSLGDLVAAQTAGTNDQRHSTTTKGNARAALRTALESIRDTARSMSEATPGLDDQFRIPHDTTDQGLVAAARAFAAEALPLKADFISYALPPAFLDELNTQIAEFESAASRQNTGLGDHVKATAAIDDRVDQALSALRELGAIVRNTFRDNPAKLAAWQSARHIDRPNRQTRRKKNGPSPPPAPTTPVAA